MPDLAIGIWAAEFALRKLGLADQSDLVAIVEKALFRMK
jgi:hypothetical protein